MFFLTFQAATTLQHAIQDMDRNLKHVIKGLFLLNKVKEGS